ncbi:hypothetical protein BUALT_Bualt16G0078300 [Buddleja alternifolia]|uniref:Flavin-containing monooxygenase n=1 Tax=Buddleja alternifolia TaxID=168488 RepID=A0AAV6WA25_9LAMI|nr:hypothetical protein BUALT_Bualt16G0078300 [Buddleja alternifolia]
MEKRVAIIGGGISGLLACKYTIAKGFHPIVFEAQNQIGGVWTQTLESTKLQVANQIYQFSDFPWPSSADMIPHNTQVLEYIQNYAQHFGLLPYIKLNSKVRSIDYEGESQEEMEFWEFWGGNGKAFGSKGKWHLQVQDTIQGSTKEYTTEFVIICIGRFSGLPNIPEFPPGHGPEVFSGKVLHSMDYSALGNATAAEFIKGKKIAVIGSGKSAVDIAYECANANGKLYLAYTYSGHKKDNPCTVIQRTIHWMLPDLQPWGVSIAYFCFTRFAELMVHKPGEGLLSSILATLLSPLHWVMSKFVESYARWKLPLKKYNMIPEESFVKEASSCQILFLQDNFYDKVEDGSIVFKKSKSFSFCKEGLILDGENDPIKLDIVIFATGYKGDEKLRNMFADPTFQNGIMGSPTSVVPLYSNAVFVSLQTNDPSPNSTTSSNRIFGVSFNVHTFEMRCMWLSFFLDQTFQLPSVKEMEKDIKTWEKYMKQYAGNSKFRRACVGAVSIWYNDQLCKDVGCNPRRKKGFFSDLFEPYGSEDYRELASEI